MNAVEIEEAVSELAERAFEAAEFPFAFLEAFGNKANTIKRLRSGGKSTTNKSDVAADGVVAVLQRNNIHIAARDGGGPDAVGSLLNQLTGSPAAARHKAKFALATDGQSIHAENLNTGESLVCDYAELADHFGFFLELADQDQEAIRQRAVAALVLVQQAKHGSHGNGSSTSSGSGGNTALVDGVRRYMSLTFAI